MLDVQRYVYLLPREIHTTNLIGLVIHFLVGIFTGEASKDKLHISMNHFRMYVPRIGYLGNVALFLALATNDVHVGMGRLS